MNILVIGGSRNIGYYSSLRFLDAGHTVSFLLRNIDTFDGNEKIQAYVSTGKAHLVQGDALVREDVSRAWAEGAAQSESGKVDLLLFTVGGVLNFKLSKGLFLTPPNITTQSLLNTLSTLPSPHPKVITISSIGLTRRSRAALPLLVKPFYSYVLPAPHRDKVCAERVLAHLAGWKWEAEEDGHPVDEILDTEGRWKTIEGLPFDNSLAENVLVVRPALLTDGKCVADEKKDGKSYRISEAEFGGWTVSRKDVAHFVADTALNRWDEYKGKRINIAY